MPVAWSQPVIKQSALFLLLAAVLAGGGYWWVISREAASPHGAANGPASADLHPVSASPAEIKHPAAPTASSGLEFPRASWTAAGLEIQPARPAPLTQVVELTGKISLNEDRVAHLFPLVEGRVDEVKIQLGDRVKKGQLLVVVQSKEVGQTMLQLYQDRLQRDFTIIKDRWTQTVSSNTLALIGLIRDGAAIEEIEKQLTDRPLGGYRDKLMSAYIGYYRAKRNLARLAPLADGGTVTGKQILEAESEWNAARATLQSLVEQLQQEAQQAAAVSTQSLKELETRVAVDETNLKILGFAAENLKSINPSVQGEAISHYPVHSPFDGTIISKDVVLLERVGPESQILSIADLSSVWVATDIYEEHLPLLARLNNQSIQLKSPAWPGETFTAKIFYTGDVVNETSRTISMRAVADNQDGRLKPGMFVNVQFPSITREMVLQLPLTSLIDHGGQSFVFVHVEGDRFERRDVTLGVRNAESVEVLSGVTAGEPVVVRGGFALKTQMLAELLAE